MEESTVIYILGVILLLMSSYVLGQALAEQHVSKMLCKSHGLEHIESYGSIAFGLNKVECGNKKPELQYDNYKVFTK